MNFRKDIPKPKKVKNLNFPLYHYEQLENGIKFFVVEDHRYPLITARFVFEAGSFQDILNSQTKPGLSSLTSEIITKGAGGLNAQDIASRIEYFGAGFSSGSDSDAAYINFHSLSEHFPKVFEVATKIILDPTFPEDEFLKIKEHKINSLISCIDDGDYLAVKEFRNEIYKNTQYSHLSDGNVESVNQLSINDVKDFYDLYYTPDNLMLVFVGDISIEEAGKLINENFSGWEKTFKKNYKNLELSLPENTLVLLTDKKNSVQADMCIGHKGATRNSPDNILLNFLNILLGGYFSSRLNKRLREKEGLTYGIRSSFNSKRYAGDFSIDASVNQENIMDSLDIIFEEINLLMNIEPSAEELQNVKNYITGTFPLQLETPNGIAIKILNKELYGLKENFYKEYLMKVNSITTNEILTTANKYLFPDNIVISICGDASVIEKKLSKFNEIKIINQIKYT